MAKFRRIFDLVSAKKDGTGSTVQFQVSKDEDTKNRCVFVTGARQVSDTNTDNARFDYKNSEKMKLGPIDIGAIMAVLRGREASINKEKGLFHQFVKDGETVTSSIKLKKNDPKYGGYFFEMRKNEMKLGMPITNANVEVLFAFLQNSLYYMYGD